MLTILTRQVKLQESLATDAIAVNPGLLSTYNRGHDVSCTIRERELTYDAHGDKQPIGALARPVTVLHNWRIATTCKSRRSVAYLLPCYS